MMKAYAAERSEPVDQCRGSHSGSYSQPQITRVGTIERRVPAPARGVIDGTVRAFPALRSRTGERTRPRCVLPQSG
jgi:hypothetical protein